MKTLTNLESLYILESQEDEILSRIKEYLKPIHEWFNMFIHNDQGSEMEFKVGSETHNDDKVKLAVKEIVDIEENIWSPSYGLKGNLCDFKEYCYT